MLLEVFEGADSGDGLNAAHTCGDGLLADDFQDADVANTVKNKLGSGYTMRNQQVIGPKVSAELFHAGIVATILAVLAIAIYVWVRFEWQYGISAASNSSSCLDNSAKPSSDPGIGCTANGSE